MFIQSIMTFYPAALQAVSRDCTRKHTHSCQNTSEIARILRTNRTDRTQEYVTEIWLLHLHWDWVSHTSSIRFFCASLSCRLRRERCLESFGSLTSSDRRPSLPAAPDGPTDGHSDVLLVRWLRRRPARSASIYHLTIQSPPPEFMFNLPVSDRYVALSRKTIKQ